MPNAIKSLFDIAENNSFLLPFVQRSTERVVKESELILSRICWNESRLKGSDNVVVTEMIKEMLENKTFKDFGLGIQNGNWSVICYLGQIASFRDKEEVSIFPWFWKRAKTQRIVEQETEIQRFR